MRKEPTEMSHLELVKEIEILNKYMDNLKKGSPEWYEKGNQLNLFCFIRDSYELYAYAQRLIRKHNIPFNPRIESQRDAGFAVLSYLDRILLPK